MATQIYNDVITLYASNKASTNTNVYNLFSRYSNKFTYDSDNNVVVYNNLLKFSFSDGGSWSGGHLRIYSMDLSTTYSDIQEYRDSQTLNVTLVVTEHSFTFFQPSSTYQYGPFCVAFYSKSATNSYAGISPNGSLNIDSISTFVNANTLAPVANYAIQRITTRTLNSPYVLFSTTNALVSSAGNFEILEDFRSCSNVSTLSTISINNKNYFALGTNTLVEAPAS